MNQGLQVSVLGVVIDMTKPRDCLSTGWGGLLRQTKGSEKSSWLR